MTFHDSHGDPHDPAASAAALLLRLGLAILLIAAPVAGVLSRRAFLVLAPLGIVVVFLAAMLDGRVSAALRGLFRQAVSPLGLALLFLAVWSASSLLWTVGPGQGAERFLKIGATLALAMLACLSLPLQMRASNLYLAPLGVALAGAVTVAAALNGLLPSRAFDLEQPTLERAVANISLLLFPAICWLATKARFFSAVLLTLLVVGGAVLAATEDSAIAVAAGGAVLLLAHRWPQATARWLGVAAGLLIVLAPLLPFLLSPISAHLPMLDGEDRASLAAWMSVVAEDPARLITGHGIDSAAQGRLLGLIPPLSPRSVLFEIWYDLGLLGALGFAALFAISTKAVERSFPETAAYANAAIACALLHGVLGSGPIQIWWMTTLSLAAIAFAAVQNGQYRSTRPRAVMPDYDRDA